jgi:fatty acid desaturase
MSPPSRYLRDPAGIGANVLALGYITVTYFGGWWLMAQPHWKVNLAGVLACAHGMIIAAYLIHDCAHNGLFERAEHNAYLGKTLNWITGACYGTYEDLRHKHMRHHVDPDRGAHRSVGLRQVHAVAHGRRAGAPQRR